MSSRGELTQPLWRISWIGFQIPNNPAASQFVEALAKAWMEFNNPRAVVMFVVQADERNMYDQHWHSAPLKEIHNVSTLRKTLAEIDAEGELLPDGTLAVGGQAIAVVLHTK
ncbi:PREDICTED: glutathione synthetase, chloroplastic-like [Prunus mume]|uniref:Glutathione synthetase, chloroplastic-like n=1 Tax=Prunus mume TaxID=102107 RepID=A0ABM0PYJ9_PRUMU|nr:PREDICTED: glutathione synthetase, chloroplastic-like [Prunus mume]XP_008246523.1 PREDICTED: glutathione synthetase, chloroplastic-like [Prunus mume]XP_016646816.1 PREDICTED: glutathione synthetase, chloroplastic-like [Prunus mume]